MAESVFQGVELELHAKAPPGSLNSQTEETEAKNLSGYDDAASKDQSEPTKDEPTEVPKQEARRVPETRIATDSGDTSAKCLNREISLNQLPRPGGVCQKKTAKVIAVVLMLLALVFLGAIITLGIVGIIQADMDDNMRYIKAFCDPDDNYEHVWLYWMAGASGASLPFTLCGTAAIALMVMLLREEERKKHEHTSQTDKYTDVMEMAELKGQKGTEEQFSAGDQEQVSVEKRLDTAQRNDSIQLKTTSLQAFTCGAAIAVASTLLFLAFGLLCLLWGIAIASNNIRTPNKAVTLYSVVDNLVGVAMPIFFILASAIFSVFLEYITGGAIDMRRVISKMLHGVKLEKVGGVEYWVIQNFLYFMVRKHDTDVRRTPGERKKRNIKFTCPGAFSRTFETWILAAIASLSFMLIASYFLDQTITMQHTHFEWPPRRNAEVDCFLWINSEFYYVSTSEQNLTDRLNDCVMFFELCEKNCSSIFKTCNTSDNCTDEFMTCSDSCTGCLGACTNSLRADIQIRARICHNSSINFSCPVSTTCTSAVPVSNTMVNCASVASAGSGLDTTQIALATFSNNTERLQNCADLLDSCSRYIQGCSTSNCTNLTECISALQPCRRPSAIHCYQFLQFGRSTDVIETLAETFALYLATTHLFAVTCILIRILLQFRFTRWWGIGFILVALVLAGGWIAVEVTDLLLVESVIKKFQLMLGVVFIFFIGLLLLLAEFPPGTSENMWCVVVSHQS